MPDHKHDSPETKTGGANDPSENGADRDIIGIPQEDLTTEDLEEDRRTETDTDASLPDEQAEDLGDFA